jgi:hypothetical protein
MSVNFPAIQPTGCTFTPPEWAITESRSQSGVRSYRIWSSKPSDAVLDLSFENISEANALAIVQAHASARGPIEDLVLPAVLFFGISNQVFIDLFSQYGSGLSWHFVNKEPPVIERVPGRRYTTRVRLRAELRFP